MPAYRSRFFNDLTNSSGHLFHCCQAEVEVAAAKSPERAIEAAKRRFCRREKIADWRVRGHAIEVEEIDRATPD